MSHDTDFAYTPMDRLVEDFASRGLVVLAPEDLGISAAVHQKVYTREKKAHDARQPVTPSSIPDVLEVLNAPGLVEACNRLVGENWAIVPFTHNASFTSGGRDQHWHKDDNGPYNSRKQRHHQAVQIEMLYYPQDVTPEMGPTATVPYSQYWTFDHEENHDNFAGADHLDFNYQLSGMEGKPISGPDSEYSTEDIVNRETAHDIRMREAVTNLGWPLVLPLEAAPLRAGSVVIYSHNTFHRGNHRRDDWEGWKDRPRFMWRFWLYRTTDAGGEAAAAPAWDGADRLTGRDLATADADVTTVWRYHDHWIRTGQAPPAVGAGSGEEAAELAERLQAKGEANEPVRVGAAYRLAALSDTGLALRHLEEALYVERESVRRAATYGLIAVGAAATEVFLRAVDSPLKWLRKAGVYGLGDASPLNEEALEAVAGRLRADASVYVRSVAAGTLGCLGRRAVANGEGTALVPACLEALVQSLAVEENRLAMDRAQGRSIKFARPTDECDVCEGNGVDFGLERFEPVRSAVRENALWSAVILCSHGGEVLGEALEPTVAALKEVVRTDKNVICVGFAMDALNRLAHLGPHNAKTDDLRAELMDLLAEPPVRAWEALVRGGLDAKALARFTPTPGLARR